MLPEHEAVENVQINRGQARFQLKECQRRAQVAHPRDALPVEVTNISELIEDGDVEDDFEFNGKGLPIPTKRHRKAKRHFVLNLVENRLTMSSYLLPLVA